MSLLSISEKREWLARIFRDKTGEYTDSDKFKAMQEDNRLAILQYTSERNKDVTAQDAGRKCSDCTFYFKDSSDPISPGHDARALGQNPTAVPCGHSSEKEDVRKEPDRKQITNKEDDCDINIP